MRQTPASLIGAFRGHADADPERVMLTWLADLAEPAAVLTAGALDDAAAAVAAALLAHAEPGHRILLVHPPGLDFVTAFIGCLYAGCVPVPVYPLLDTEENVGKLRYVQADSGAALAWTSGPQIADAVRHALGVPSRWETGTDRHRPEREMDPGTLAFLQYTSGSTTEPRGVMVTHGNLAANLGAIREAFRTDEDSVMLSWLPAYHDMGLIGNILHPLHVGCHVYLASPVDFIRSPLSWPASVARFAVTISGAPNFAYDLVVRAASRQALSALDLGAWRTAYCGAEPVSHAALARFADLLAPYGFRRDAFVPCYGLAEATLLVTSAPVGGTVVTRRGPDGLEAVCCGPPRGCELAVVDELCTPVSDGVTGEILVQGASVASGYFHRPEASRSTFRQTVAGRAGTWLRTGDLGFVHDGELFVTGRVKDVIIVRGRNHHPQDIERLVTEACPALRPGCVVAFASPAADGAVIVAELRVGDQLSQASRLALNTAVATSYGLAVREIVTVPKGTLPKTTSGKLRRAECRARYLAGDYDPYREAAAEPAEPAEAAEAAEAAEPAEPAEAAEAAAAPGTDALRAAVREVLNTDVADDDPLVMHGLDSLGAVRLAELLLRHAGVDVPVRTLLHGATVADLAASPVSATAATSGHGDAGGLLSRAQESLLFLHMLDPASDAYAITFAWEPAPETDFRALETAVRTALSWHPELSMRIAGDERGTWRRVPVARRELDQALALSPVPVPEDRLDDHLSAAAALPFDLHKGPLLRLHNWQTPARRVYQFVVHHIVTDLWSLCLLLRDIGTCYAACSRGTAPVRPAAAPYDAYVAEQVTYLESPMARDRDEELRVLLPARGRSLDVPTDAPYHAKRATRGGQVTAAVQAQHSAAADPVATMIVLWAATLQRYGTPDPVVVGVPASGRGYGRHATVSGLCTNTVPIALQTGRNRSLATLVTSAREQLDRGMDAPLYPLARAVEAVRPERVPGRHPLLETLITIQENPIPEVPGLLEAISGRTADLTLGRLSLRALPVARRSCRYDLDLVITPRGDGYLLTLDYAADLFTRDTAESILATFRAAVIAAFTRGGATLGDVLPLSERDESLLSRVSTHDSRPLTPALLARVRRVAMTDPHRPAVSTATRTWSYAEFVARVDAIAAAAYTAAETGHSDTPAPGHAALLLAFPADFAAAMFGAWNAGLGILPLPSDHPDARLLHMLTDRRPRLLITCPALASRARRLALEADQEMTILVVGEFPAATGTHPPPPPADAPAFTVYTSGSTGTPKGVCIRHDQISPLVAWSEREWALGPWARIAQTLSLGFDFGLQELFTVLPTGGCVVVPDPEDRRTARSYARFLRRARVTVLFTTPSFAAELAAAGEPLPDLRLVLLGGEVLRRSTVVGLRALAGPHCRMYNGYGPTEATVNCLMYEIPRDLPDTDLPDVLPVGTATAASRVHLVDSGDRPVPVGATGEILIGGPGVAEGYLNQPELTAARFVTLPLDKGPVYRTGDRAYVRPDSGYVVIGRTDRQVKVGGFRVELGEVEHVLSGAPGVKSAVVRVFGDPGELTAFLTGHRIDLAAVASHAASLLSPAMMPTRLIPLDRMPTTVNGKLDEGTLAEAAAAVEPRPLPSTASPAEIENAICSIWAAALDLPAVDSGANVFELGAHSLIVTRVHSRMQSSVGVEFHVHELFEYPRPRDLARCIVARRRAIRIGSLADLSAANAKEEQ